MGDLYAVTTSFGHQDFGAQPRRPRETLYLAPLARSRPALNNDVVFPSPEDFTCYRVIRDPEHQVGGVTGGGEAATARSFHTMPGPAPAIRKFHHPADETRLRVICPRKHRPTKPC